MRRVTSLGMPARPIGPTTPTWKQAWDDALYGERGFFRRESPADHFRTAVHASPLLAEALAQLVRGAGLDTVVDVGAGRGELLAQLHALDPGLTLLGVEVAARPAPLPESIGWTHRLPESVDGLLVANEWLDNVPAHVVEVGDDGRVHVVHVDPALGVEELGAAVDEPGVPGSIRDWVEAWWPLAGAEPGLRAEVGTTRDRAWRDAASRVRHGLAVAIDYGHLRADRPPFGTLASYRRGRLVEVLPDGSRDVTAHVAVDSAAAAVGGRVLTQREALRALGVSAARPDLALATADPAAYVRALSRASEAAELSAPDGLGGFYWVVSEAGGARSPLAPEPGAGTDATTGS